MPSICFGEFSLDTGTFELRRKSERVRIQQQPARILALLATNPGTLVSRNQIRTTIWGHETFVDFEQSLNFCIRQIRIALNDDAERPAYVETLPRLGYRFIAAAREDKRKEPGAVVNRHRVAVLPFAHQGGGQEDYFTLALTESMIAQLSRIDPARLGVVSGPKHKATEDGDNFESFKSEFHLDYVLQGWVRRAEGEIWIGCRLYDLRDRSVLWSETYTRKNEDLAAIQSEVALRVSQSLALELIPGSGSGVRKYSRTPAAYDAYLKGRFFWHKMTDVDMRTSIKYFNEALSIDPTFASACAGLADCYAQMGSVRVATMKPREALAKARPLLDRALALDDTLAEAHCTSALLKSWYEHDWAGAEREFRLALSLEPGNVTALLWQSLFLSAMGRVEEAIESTLRAREIDPFSTVTNTYVGLAIMHTGRYDEAMIQFDQAIELDRHYYRAWLFKGLALGWLGRIHEAVKAFDEALTLNSGNLEAVAFRGAALALEGDRSGAERALAVLEETRNRFEPALLKACIFAGMRKEDEMFRCLDLALERKSGPLYIIRFFWAFSHYRSHPRLRSIIESIGLPPW
jgi:TolB-like protein/Tfp pilus assembly protein PilF